MQSTSGLITFGMSPKGYLADGTPIGGRRKGAGRKPKPDLIKTSLKLTKENVELIQELPLGQRYEIINKILRAGLKRFLKQGGAK
jgi:hypothetical protein